MPKSPITVRTEVHLMPDVVKELKKKAKEKGWSTKHLLEWVLEQYAAKK